jgi:K+-transporting ATPase ATPase C chain
MLTLLLRQGGAALRMLLVATVVLGLVYPFAVWGISQVPGLHGPAEGSVVTAPDGTPVGSSLIGIDPVAADPAADPYFHTASAPPGRPRPATLDFGGSNQGGFSISCSARSSSAGRDRRPGGRRA